MKHFFPRRILFITILSALLSGCTKDIDANQLQFRGDLAYEINASKPFSGNVNSLYSNGQIKDVTIYSDGKKHGASTQHFKNGVVKFEGTFKAGVLDGDYIRRHSNGKLHVVGNKVDGTGTEKVYDNNGHHYQIKSIKNNKTSSVKYSDLGYAYKLMLEMASLPEPSDKDITANLERYKDSHPAQVFSFRVFDWEATVEQYCEQKNMKFYYPSGKLFKECTEETETYFYPNGTKWIWFTNADDEESPYQDETFTANGDSCGKQSRGYRGESKLTIFYPNCDIEWEEFQRDGENYLTKYHNVNSDFELEIGTYTCIDNEDNVTYEGKNINCK